jgi:hypothetical protein
MGSPAERILVVAPPPHFQNSAKTEMALHVLAYNLTCAMNIMGIQPLMAAMRA